MRVCVLFRFVFEDVPLFLGLINDLFPGLDCPRVRYPSFNDAVEAVLAENNYVLLDTQVDKVVQMYETMMTRHTTMIVGPTCGGKSVVINTLCQSQGKLNIPTKVHTLNAKGYKPNSPLYLPVYSLKRVTYILTSRERLKSALYLRLKIVKGRGDTLGFAKLQLVAKYGKN